MSMTAEAVAAFEAEAIASAEAIEAAFERLVADLARHPESPTLNGLALRDKAGAVVGQCCPTDALGLAYDADAPAWLIVEAERLAALVGNVDDPGHRYRGLRLAHAVRAMNRRLAAYSGCHRSIGTVTVSQTSAAYAPAIALAELDAERASSALTADHGHDPPRPLDAATTSPHRPCAPNARAQQRGHEWLSPRRHGRASSERKQGRRLTS